MALEQEFGTLRSILSQAEIDEGTLWALLLAARQKSPEAYDTQWLPYLAEHTLPVPEVSSIPSFFDHCAILPETATLHLDISQEHDPRRLEKWLSSPHLRRMSRLSMYKSRVRDGHLKRLLAGGGLTNLHTLYIQECEITDEGAAALLSSESSAGIHDLSLHGHDDRITERTCVALASATHITGICTLDLASNQITDAGVEALASATNLTHLSLLELSNTELTDHAAQALAGAPGLGRLSHIGLDLNLITHDGATALAESPHLPSDLYVELLENPCYEEDNVTGIQNKLIEYSHYDMEYE